MRLIDRLLLWRLIFSKLAYRLCKGSALEQTLCIDPWQVAGYHTIQFSQLSDPLLLRLLQLQRPVFCNPHSDILALPVDVLIPAAREDVIISDNAHRIKAKIIVEGANGPTSSEADDLLEFKDILIVPDILANAGGVIVSYFEWLQNYYHESWSIQEVDSKLEDMITSAFHEVFNASEFYRVSPRIAVYAIAVKRVVEKQISSLPVTPVVIG